MVLKARDYKPEIGEFKFGSLTPNISKDGKSKPFNLKSLNNASNFKNGITEDILREEREAESKTDFLIDSKVRESRGITKQETKDIENRVFREVLERVGELREQATQDGFEEGKKEGFEKAYSEAVEKFNVKIEEFGTWLDELKLQREAILQSSEKASYEVIKNLVKWVLLKEVEDKEYIPRLLEKLILEINQKSNLLIKVDKKSFVDFEDVLENIQNKLGKLSNTRVEIGLELDRPGLILESENGIVDGSLEAQFSSLDKLFELVMNSDDK